MEDSIVVAPQEGDGVVAVSATRAHQPQELHTNRQWRGLELKCDPLHDILLVQLGEGFLLWDLEIFPRHVRVGSQCTDAHRPREC